MSYNNPYQNDNPYAENYAMQDNVEHSQAGGDFVTFMNGINQINVELDDYTHLINQIDSCLLYTSRCV